MEYKNSQPKKSCTSVRTCATRCKEFIDTESRRCQLQRGFH